MNDKHILYIMTILKEGSFTAAAKKLYITQPSLSQIVKAAEASLGAPIFDRSSDPISLTPAGRLFVDATSQIMEISENLKRQIQDLNQNEAGILRLGIAVQRAIHLLPKLYPLYSGRYPHVRIKLVECGSVHLENRILENKADIACMATIPKNIQLEYRLIREEHYVLLVNPGCSLARRIPNHTPIDISEARDECFINCKPGHSIHQSQQAMFSTRGMDPAVAFETDSIEVGKATVSAYPAVMMCPDVYADQSGESHYHIYPLLNVDTPRHFYACYKKDAHLSGYMKGFLDVLTELKD